jgi:hypothetical protein
MNLFICILLLERVVFDELAPDDCEKVYLFTNEHTFNSFVVKLITRRRLDHMFLILKVNKNIFL